MRVLRHTTGAEAGRALPWNYNNGIGELLEEIQRGKISEEWWRLPRPVHQAADLPNLEAKLIRARVIMYSAMHSRV